MISNFSKKLKQIGLTEYPKLLFTKGLSGISLGKTETCKSTSEISTKIPWVAQRATVGPCPAWNGQQQLEEELLDTVEFIGKTLRDLANSLHRNNEEMFKMVKQSAACCSTMDSSGTTFKNQHPERGCATVSVPSDRLLATLTPTPLQTTEENSVYSGKFDCLEVARSRQNQPKELNSSEFGEIRQLLEHLGKKFGAQSKQLNSMLSTTTCRPSMDLGVQEIKPIMERLDKMCAELAEMKQCGEMKTEPGSQNPIDTALMHALEELNSGLATLGKSSCEILSKLELLNGKIALPDNSGLLDLPTAMPEQLVSSPEAREINFDAALRELKTRVQTLEEQSCLTLKALAGLQKSRPVSPIESSISCTPLEPPSLPKSATTPGTASPEVPETTSKSEAEGAVAGGGGGNDDDDDSNPVVLETLDELKSLLQLLGQDLDLIVSHRNSPECSFCGHRKDTKLKSTGTCGDGRTAQLLEELRSGVLNLIEGIRRIAPGGACGQRDLPALPKPQKKPAVSEDLPASSQLGDSATKQTLRELKVGIQVLTEEFCKFQHRGVCQTQKSSPQCRRTPNQQLPRINAKVGKSISGGRCSPQPKSKSTDDRGIKKKSSPFPTRCAFAFSIAPLRPQAVAYPENSAGGRKRPAGRLEAGRPLWDGAPGLLPTPPTGLPQTQVHGQVDCALERLPRASHMAATGQKSFPSGHKRPLGAEIKGKLPATPSAPQNTPVPEEEIGNDGGRESDLNANFNFPVGTESRQNSNARLKWIALTPVSEGGETAQFPTQSLSGDKPKRRLQGFRISYNKTRTHRR
ncbi:unnamed protein product [Schistocephalus solidus]|uniref:Coiled-coil domain-containing protein 14 n=1 Tax=Schistocephalus solidus TaxID=70667 RepID=A0A183T2E9_SCHSO|nr:unnamed protein product [Schistocephalus solidus]